MDEGADFKTEINKPLSFEEWSKFDGWVPRHFFPSMYRYGIYGFFAILFFLMGILVLSGESTSQGELKNILFSLYALFLFFSATYHFIRKSKAADYQRYLEGFDPKYSKVFFADISGKGISDLEEDLKDEQRITELELELENESRLRKKYRDESLKD